MPLDKEDIESQPLTFSGESAQSDTFTPRSSRTSSSSDSTSMSLLEHLHGPRSKQDGRYKDDEEDEDKEMQEFEMDEPMVGSRTVDARYKRWLYIISMVCFLGWLLALALFILGGSYKHRSTLRHDPDTVKSLGAGKKITIDQLQSGQWSAARHAIKWVAGPQGEDGLLMEVDSTGPEGFLVVKDVRARSGGSNANSTKVLMKQPNFWFREAPVYANQVWPSPDFNKVLVMSDAKKNWRHSYTGRYWLVDVATQQGEPLDRDHIEDHVQLALWSPDSSAVSFVRDNNLYVREIHTQKIRQVTQDGGPNMFNGVPDWVYEEEVFAGNTATWWSEDGKYLAFLSTNETEVPEYPVQYFVSRPSGERPEPGLENYPEVRQIKYPKAGAPNPVVQLRFYDVDQDEAFTVPIEGDFEDDNRLITEIVWAGSTGKVLIRETNRESDILKMVLVDVWERKGHIVREKDVMSLDGGWFEVTEKTTFVPKDVANGREHDGYIDTVIHEGYDHLAYFSPLDNPEPKLLTSGKWEVVDAPSAIDLRKNVVYFVATRESSIQRHVYKVGLDGSSLEPFTDISADGWYDVSFSKLAGFALLSYDGPAIPWQKLVSTPSNEEKYEHLVEDNQALSRMASEHELPLKRYSTVNIEGVDLNVVERLPHHFDKNKKYPVLFFVYGGPGSQQVKRDFAVDFQSYVAATLGYIVVTVDGRGTGFIGRANRVVVRGEMGHYEAIDQIKTAKIWAAKQYVDPTRMAIWGWSYGGYMTLKTLEADAGDTFRYGMAVAPVTDWQFYDSIYTERYMHTPQHNPDGYHNTSVHDVEALGQTTRFLIMHGVADDNVHLQNTLTLLDKLDLAGIENYDVHVFPDSDHSIYFHNANRIVYDKLNWWLINAFNGEWARIDEAKPLREGAQVGADG